MKYESPQERLAGKYTRYEIHFKRALRNLRLDLGLTVDDCVMAGRKLQSATESVSVAGPTPLTVATWRSWEAEGADGRMPRIGMLPIIARVLQQDHPMHLFPLPNNSIPGRRFAPKRKK